MEMCEECHDLHQIFHDKNKLAYETDYANAMVKFET